jgi:hypothetical protein
MTDVTPVPEPASTPAVAKPPMSEAERNRARDMLVATSKAAEAFAELPQKFEKVLAGTVDVANAYVSKMLTVGYATFFAIWALTKSYMSPAQVFLTALLMLVSVAIFVANEIFNITMINRVARALLSAEPLKTYKDLAAKVEGIETELRSLSATATRYRGIQSGSLYTTLAFACGAVLVMVYALLVGLWAATR